MFAPSICYGAIFGDGNDANGVEDGRVAAPANLLSAVGTIFCDGGLRGTGTHIDPGLATDHKERPSIIVTAAHVLFDANTGAPFSDCSYRPENKRLRSVPFAQVSSHAYQPLAQDKMRQSETDIVFVALQRHLYQDRLPLAQTDNTSGLQLLAYNPSNERIDISGGCQTYDSVNFKSKDLLLHNCDAERGSSGGPLLQMKNSDSETQAVGSVIAIHGGTLSSAGNGVPGAKVQPEKWINQARKVDRALLLRLQEFLAYLRKGSAN